MNENPLTILLYHGVTSHKGVGIENFSGKHINVNDFVKQMEYVNKNANVLSMDEVVYKYSNNEPLPKNAVSITFDDGFENNSTEAAPILDDLNLPATFYITSGIVNTNMMFWVDQLEDIINLTKLKKITLNLDKKVTFSLSSFKEKIKALVQIKNYCKISNKNEKDRVIYDLSNLCSVESSVIHSPNYNKIKWAQLIEMNKNPLFTIGGHSLYHDILTSLTTEEMRNDIRLSIDLLEFNLKKKILHYSYPEGQKNHFNESVINALKAQGIESSPSAINGINYPSETNLFNLKRIMVGFSETPFPKI